MADIVNNAKIEHTQPRKFEHNSYFLITPRMLALGLMKHRVHPLKDLVCLLSYFGWAIYRFKFIYLLYYLY